MEKDTRATAMRLIVMMGIVALLGDVIYEGARSANGPYLEELGASAALIGVIGGVGEFLGYSLRLATGYFSDRTRAYWSFVIIGYGMLLSVPLLALTGIWQFAALFMVFERLGKAVRSPAKDTILSRAARQFGTGWGFAIHEALDQIGAVAGPLLFAAAFVFIGGNTDIPSYQKGYAVFIIPFIILLAFLLYTYIRVGKPARDERPPAKAGPEDLLSSSPWRTDGPLGPEDRSTGLPGPRRAPPVVGGLLLDEFAPAGPEADTLSKTFWLYCAFSFLSTLGLVSFILIGYHLKATGAVPDAAIPLMYTGAMLVDAGVALVIGKSYDRMKVKNGSESGGLLLLIVIPVLTVPIPFLAFSTDILMITGAVFLFGAVMGAHETIMKAAIADITTLKKRGTGYGIFNTAYGMAMFIGSAVAGVLYDISLPYLLIFVTLIEIAAVPVFFLMARTCGQGPGCAAG